MAVTDQVILSEIQRVTLENTGDNGATWPSGMWTQAEVLGYLNQRQNRFLAATALTWTVGATALIPLGYYEIDGVTTTTFVVPQPTDVGSAIERYYVALGTVMDASGINFSVPDEFVPTIKYGCLADMFAKIGQAQNLVLSSACEDRWQEGIEIGQLMATEGWLAL